MKQVKFIATFAVALVALFLISCNSGDKVKTTDNAVDSSTANKEAVITAPVASGPIQVMTVTHKVANYAKWKPGYDAGDSDRLANGLHNYVIARGIEDSNMVMVALKMDDVNKAKEMAGSQRLKDTMKKAGVTGAPSVDYIESVVNDTTFIDQTVRLMVKHKVKDWDVWKKAFDSHKQMRVDAGLTDRVIGYTVDDNHKVTLVFAVADVAKAKEFLNSKNLKDKMTEAGVDGPPSFFFYKIATRY